MTFSLNIIELRYLVEEYGLSGYLNTFRAEDCVSFIRELTVALKFWEDGDDADGEEELDDDSKFGRDFTSIIDIELPEEMCEMVEHSFTVLTYADVLESCGRYVPRKASKPVDSESVEAGGFDGSSLESDAIAYIDSNYDAVVGCLRDLRKYVSSNDRFKPELFIYTDGTYHSSDKKCCLNLREFLKTEELMATQCLVVQAAEIDFNKIKEEWKNLVMARLMEEVSMCYVRFVKKELILSGQDAEYPHSEFFMYGACWGAAYLCMYEELIKPRIAD